MPAKKPHTASKKPSVRDITSIISNDPTLMARMSGLITQAIERKVGEVDVPTDMDVFEEEIVDVVTTPPASPNLPPSSRTRTKTGARMRVIPNSLSSEPCPLGWSDDSWDEDYKGSPSPKMSRRSGGRSENLRLVGISASVIEEFESGMEESGQPVTEEEMIIGVTPTDGDEEMMAQTIEVARKYFEEMLETTKREVEAKKRALGLTDTEMAEISLPERPDVKAISEGWAKRQKLRIELAKERKMIAAEREEIKLRLELQMAAAGDVEKKSEGKLKTGGND